MLDNILLFCPSLKSILPKLKFSEIWLLLLFRICSLSFLVVALQRVLGGLDRDLTWSKLGDGVTREERDDEEERTGSLDCRLECIILIFNLNEKKKCNHFIQM